jgi:hypothetical protein
MPAEFVTMIVRRYIPELTLPDRTPAKALIDMPLEARQPELVRVLIKDRLAVRVLLKVGEQALRSSGGRRQRMLTVRRVCLHPLIDLLTRKPDQACCFGLGLTVFDDQGHRASTKLLLDPR